MSKYFLFAIFFSIGTLNVAASGQQRCSAKVVEVGEHATGFLASTHEGKILVADLKSLYFVNPDGLTKAPFDAAENIRDWAKVYEDGLISVYTDHHLYILNPDGSLKWSFNGENIDAPLQNKNGAFVFKAFQNQIFFFDNKGVQLALNQEIGESRVSLEAIMDDGTVVVSSYDKASKSGYLYLLDNKGKLKSKTKIPGFISKVIKKKDGNWLIVSAWHLTFMNSNGKIANTIAIGSNFSAELKDGSLLVINPSDAEILNSDGTLKLVLKTNAREESLLMESVVQLDGSFAIPAINKVYFFSAEGALKKVHTSTDPDDQSFIEMSLGHGGIVSTGWLNGHIKFFDYDGNLKNDFSMGEDVYTSDKPLILADGTIVVQGVLTSLNDPERQFVYFLSDKCIF